MQNEEKIELFEYIPVSKSVIKLALPMILSSLTVIIYNMADTFFVWMLADPIQNAAITLAAPIMLAFNVISNLLGVGTASMTVSYTHLDVYKRQSAGSVIVGSYA